MYPLDPSKAMPNGLKVDRDLNIKGNSRQPIKVIPNKLKIGISSGFENKDYLIQENTHHEYNNFFQEPS